jgi:hypothetical protein
MSESAMQQVPEDHPLKKAWDAYVKTPEYQNSLHWAMTIEPMIQAGDPDAKMKRYGLMPVEQRQQHVFGSLWSAFSAGFEASGGKRHSA